MNDTVVRVRIWLVCLLIVAAGLAWSMPYWASSSDSRYLRVAFLDVGQGDAVLITAPSGEELLIDGGRESTVLSRLSRQQGFWDREIEAIVATHFDADHIGGLDDVLARYKVGTVLVAGNTTNSPEAEAFETALSDKGLVGQVVRAGDVLLLGASTTVEILSPTYNVADIESNNSSIVLLVRYGATSFLLTGDAPSQIEDYLVTKYGTVLVADVLKLGHHGSRTSSSLLFLETVDALYGVVSAGVDNTYGHPHEEVVAAVESLGMILLETAREGDIVFYSDGEQVWRE